MFEFYFWQNVSRARRMKSIDMHAIIVPTQSHKPNDEYIDMYKRFLTRSAYESNELNFNFGSIIRWMDFHWSETNLFLFKLKRWKKNHHWRARACARVLACSLFRSNDDDNNTTITMAAAAATTFTVVTIVLHIFFFFFSFRWPQQQICWNMYLRLMCFHNSFSSVSFHAENGSVFV